MNSKNKESARIHHISFNSKMKNTWEKASADLGFKIVFAEDKPIGKSIKYFAFLPEYGSKKGIYLGFYIQDESTLNSALSKFCKQSKVPCSFINPETFKAYKKQYFIDTLLDWGYCGETLPTWTKKRHVPWS